jgi:hypothetical protein
LNYEDGVAGQFVDDVLTENIAWYPSFEALSSWLPPALHLRHGRFAAAPMQLQISACMGLSDGSVLTIIR